MCKRATSFTVKARKSCPATTSPGVITQEAWDMIKRAMKEQDVLILIDGEEDLLTLPCIVESPPGAVVLYGQPSQGLVVVSPTPGVKEETRLILGRMSISETNH